MAEVGSLGDIIFTVSADTVKTLDNLKWSGSVTIAKQARHMNIEKAEFTGKNLDKISFEITLSKYLGVNDPMEDMATLLDYERSGKILLLTIGGHKYGRYRWLIGSHNITQKHYTENFDVATATVSLELTEYPRR